MTTRRRSTAPPASEGSLHLALDLDPAPQIITPKGKRRSSGKCRELGKLAEYLTTPKANTTPASRQRTRSAARSEGLQTRTLAGDDDDDHHDDAQMDAEEVGEKDKENETPKSGRESQRKRKVNREKEAPRKEVQVDVESEEKDTKKAATPRKRRKKQESELIAALKDQEASLVLIVRDMVSEPGAELGKRLVLLALETCGVPEEVAVQFMEENGTSWTLRDLANFTLKIAESDDCSVEAYMLGEQYQKKAGDTFVKTFHNFWIAVAEEGGSAIVEDEAILLTVDSFTDLSESNLLAFRHTAVEVLRSFGLGLLKLKRSLFQKFQISMDQLRDKATKHSQLKKAFEALEETKPEGDGSPLESSMKMWRKAVTAAKITDKRFLIRSDRALDLFGKIKTIFDFVLLWHQQLVERARDSNPMIRSRALLAISEWVKEEPLLFSRSKNAIEERFVDIESKVRANACRAFAVIGASGGQESEEVKQRLKQWIRRVKKNFLFKHLIADNSSLVAHSALLALKSIQTVDPIEMDRPEFLRIAQCMCYESLEENPVTEEEDIRSVRKTAAQICMTIFHEANPPEELPSGSNSAATTARARLQLASFVELLNLLAGNNDGSGSSRSSSAGFLPKDVMSNLIDSVWDIEECSFLRNWDSMLSTLRSYGQSDESSLSQMRGKMVASILVAACERAELVDPKIKSAREKKALQTERESMIESLHESLLQYLSDCISAYRLDDVVLESILSLLYKVDPAKCTSETDRASLETLFKQVLSIYEQKYRPELLSTIASSVVEHFCKGEEHPMQERLLALLNTHESSCISALQKRSGICLNMDDIEDRDAALLDLETSARRVSILARLTEKYETFPVTGNIFDELCKLGEILAVAPSKASMGALAEIITVLQIDATRRYTLASRAGFLTKGGASAARSEEFVGSLNETIDAAFIGFSRLALLLEKITDCCESDRDNLFALVLPCYNDLCILGTERLEGTVLAKLIWTPSQILKDRMDTFACKLFPSKYDSGPISPYDTALLGSGPLAIRTICLSTCLRNRISSRCSSRVDGVPDKLNANILSFLSDDNNDGEDKDDPTDDDAESVLSQDASSKADQILLHQGANSLLAFLHDYPSFLACDLLEVLKTQFLSTESSLKDSTASAAKIARLICPSKRVSENILSCMIQVCELGIKFSLSQSSRVDFLKIVKPFMEVLNKRYLGKLQEYWVSHITSISPDAAEAVFGSNGKKKNPAFVAIEDILGVSTRPESIASESNDRESLLSIRTGSTLSKKRSLGVDSRSDEMEELEVPVKRTRRKIHNPDEEDNGSERSDDLEEVQAPMMQMANNSDEEDKQSEPSDDLEEIQAPPAKKSRRKSQNTDDDDESLREAEKNLYESDSSAFSKPKTRKIPIRPSHAHSTSDNLFEEASAEGSRAPRRRSPRSKTPSSASTTNKSARDSGSESSDEGGVGFETIPRALRSISRKSS